ncbi:MAG: hypothetical protein FJ293_01925 [Planctomycetes bacterium]|nr:hypothetical protein [Planctomycetota bacterium]
MRARIACAVALAPLLSACMVGRIYQHTHAPLDLNLTATPVFTGFDQTGKSAVDHLNIPLTGVQLDLLWDSNAIGDVMRRNGLEEVHYADLETFNVLGIWQQYTVHAYGRRAAK